MTRPGHFTYNRGSARIGVFRLVPTSAESIPGPTGPVCGENVMRRSSYPVLTLALAIVLCAAGWVHPPRAAAQDIDGDGIPDSLEGGIFPPAGKTNTYLPDSDGDGLADGVEDANQNGILDPGETDPRSRDSDGDGYSDGIEVLILLSDPLDPLDPAGPFIDGDFDGLPLGIDPDDANPDTDGDRFLDGHEAEHLGFGAVGNPALYPLLGDVNEDGNRDLADALLILDFISARPTPGMNAAHSDVNRDGMIDNADAQMARNFAEGVLWFYPFNEALLDYTTPTPPPPTATPTPTTPAATPTPEATATPVFGNLLQNPGAETGDFSYWTTGIVNGPNAPRLDPDQYVPSPPNRSGSHRFGYQIGWQSGEAYQYQTVDVVPGASYSASMWFVRQDGTDEAVDMTWFDGVWQQGVERTIYTNSGAAVSNWTHLSGATIVPSRLQATIVIRYRHWIASNICGIHVDDLVLYGPIPGTMPPTPTPTPTNTPAIPFTPTNTPVTGAELLTNADFEGTFAANGVAQGWTGFAVSPNGFWKENEKLGRLGGGIYGCRIDLGCPEDEENYRLMGKTYLVSQDRDNLIVELPNRLGPEVITIAKWDAEAIDYPDGNTWQTNAYEDGKHFANYYYNTWITKFPGTAADAYYGLNEPSVNVEADLIKVCDFEMGFVHRMHELGQKAIVLNNSVGTPGDINLMYIPAVRNLLAEADYVGYHAYGDWNYPHSMCSSSANPYTFRWQPVAETYIANGWRFPPVIYTEAGQYWWEGEHTPEWIRDDLICYEGRARTEEFWSLGICYFVTSAWDGGWNEMNIGMYPLIIDGCRATNMAHPVDARSGTKSQEFGGSKQSFDRGIVRSVGTVAGRNYRFTGWMKYEYEDGWPCSAVIRVGWDPTGQTSNANAATVQWSADLISTGPNNPIYAGPWETDLWYHYDATFNAMGSTSSLWIRGAQATGSTSTRIYVDDVSLKEVQ
jgi:hypothetical protein